MSVDNMYEVIIDEKGVTITWEDGSFHRPGATSIENPEQYVPTEHRMNGAYREIGIYRYYAHRGNPPKAADGFFPTSDPWIMMKPVEECSGRETKSERVACCMRDKLWCNILNKEIQLTNCYQCPSARK